MTKAIATAPNEPTIYEELTTAEQTARDAEEAQALADKPMNDWVSAMAETDAGMPRYMEDVISVLSATARGNLPVETIDKYNAKIALRATMPV